ncbi:MAG: hypothetical protein GX066_07350 [Clostridiaceae bacterium]|nr:hypothetical protein [Clostridiaceae bacterium]
MAGAEKIKDRILEEAHLQAQKNMEKAKREAYRIMEDARREAYKRRAEIIERAHREAAEKKKRMIAIAELEARKKRLQAKQEVVEEAFSKALNNIISLPENKYLSILEDLVVAAVTVGKEEVILSERDRKRLGNSLVKAINKKLKRKGLDNKVKLSQETRDISGGFILKSGEVEINNSFEAIIKMQRDILEADVVKVLFS